MKTLKIERARILLATLIILTFAFSSVKSDSPSTVVASSGTIQYSQQPPPPPSGEYYDLWVSDYRVDPRFTNYLTSTFDFDEFFTQLYDRFLSELEDTVYGVGYVRPTLDYGSPSYSPGEPVGNLRSIATYVCSSVTEITSAISASKTGDIIFIEAGNYTVPSLRLGERGGIIVAGDGWDTVLKLKDNAGVNPLIGGWGAHDIIIRDIKLVGNSLGNPPDGDDSAQISVFSGDPSVNYDILYENVYFVDATRFCWNHRDGTRHYVINCLVRDAGWNCISPARMTYYGAIGNYVTEWRDVGITTWGGDHVLYANNVIVNPVWGVGFGGGNIGIMGESQRPGWNPAKDSHDIIIRNNICSEGNAAPYEERWRGTGIWFSGQESDMNQGTYNIIIDGNICENNNARGIYVNPSTKYAGTTWGATVVVQSNYAAGNNVYDIVGNDLWNDIVITRPGVVVRNNDYGTIHNVNT